jgi:DnaJ-class molecular chaperone
MKESNQKPTHCESCGGSGWIESEVKCPDCNAELKVKKVTKERKMK